MEKEELQKLFQSLIKQQDEQLKLQREYIKALKNTSVDTKFRKLYILGSILVLFFVAFSFWSDLKRAKMFKNYDGSWRTARLQAEQRTSEALSRIEKTLGTQ